MNKKIMLSLVCLLLVCTGCSSKEEKTMKKYATDYYNNYMKGIDMDSYIISIDMLENANDKAGAKYDLTKLKKCSKESKVTISFDDKDKIEKINYDMDCK